ncbi:MAG: glycosyltransferase family 4 protein [Planctomycetes bacterium]|nr:glycosyltransferase family 4 protein [Planctomycetota bacterium]
MKIMHVSRASIMVWQFLLPLIEVQTKRGHDVSVCGSNDTYADTLRERGLHVVTHELKRTLNLWAIFKAIVCIKRHIKAEKIDVLVCHSPLGAGVGRIAGWWAGVPCCVYFAHGLPCVPGQNKLKWSLWFLVERSLARITDALLVMNQYDQKLGERHLMSSPEQVMRVPGMGIDLGRFDGTSSRAARQQLARTLCVSEHAKFVLCIAYMIPAKGIYVYFQAAQKICQVRDDVVFLIAGDGPHEKALETTAFATGLGDRFHVLGWRDDIDELMRVCDIFTLPTYYFEGLPVSILEAMACGKPVVATQHRGCEDVVVPGETGMLVPTRKAPALARALLKCILDEPLCQRLGEAGRRRAEQEFELAHCTDMIADAIEKAYLK